MALATYQTESATAPMAKTGERRASGGMTNIAAIVTNHASVKTMAKMRLFQKVPA
ncbi:hypothetical protein Sa4125_15340 [Aureimonas sp. SA4125]|nr:hypothetical protein Sa4125_15340 [Aureimonas sp. SA4125]